MVDRLSAHDAVCSSTKILLRRGPMITLLIIMVIVFKEIAQVSLVLFPGDAQSQQKQETSVSTTE